MIKPILYAVFALLIGALRGSPASAQTTSNVHADRLGITFISSADHPADETRYQQAALLGASWNRWPLYWQNVERQPGSFDWSVYDALVAADLQHGLRIDAILLGIPDFYREGQTIRGLDSPVFSDGSDTPGPGKTPSDGNPWARFVYAAAARYPSAGGAGVGVWEAWNEPDLTMFWGGTVEQYARLLKVAYLAAHQADPGAQVMFAGLAYTNPEADDWLAKVLAVYAADPGRTASNWYMDQVAVHNYSNPWHSGFVIRQAQDDLKRYGLARPVWLNESGVPVWDDYPGPTWTADDPASRRLRATMQQAADFVVQSTAYAWASGADVVFYHQLYDDCGNQASGTDFPPNDPGLCQAGQSCWGDAHGLFRNDRNAVCFRQSPLPGTARPAAGAFHLMAQVFSQPFGSGTVLNLSDSAVVIAFDRADTSERIYVMWNSTGTRSNLNLPASGDRADLYTLDNHDYVIAPTDGKYTIGLPAATPDDYPYLLPGQFSAIGGPTFIMVEKLAAGAGEINPALIDLEPFDPNHGPTDTRGVGGFGLPAGGEVHPTPGSVLGGGGPVTTTSTQAQDALLSTPPPPTLAPTDAPLIRPTVDPASDTTPPIPSMIPLPLISPPTFTVAWGATDNSGIAAYTVFARIDGGDWQPWLQETTETQAQYAGASGHGYEFAVWAKDLAGNWSANTELSAMARTSVQ